MADIEIAKKEDLDGLARNEDVEDALNGKADKVHTHTYDEIENTPSIPSKISQLDNDLGFITNSDIPTVPTNISDLNNDIGFITGSYDNTGSGLSATDIQSAIDELKALIDGLADDG